LPIAWFFSMVACASWNLLQLVNLMNRQRESSGGDRVEVAPKRGLRQVAGVAAVAGETHAAGDV